MFQNTDFWIGLGIGVVAGVFGYKLMSEREQQLLAMQQPAAGALTASVPLAELQRQKEELEDMIAAQEAAQAKYYRLSKEDCCLSVTVFFKGLKR